MSALAARGSLIAEDGSAAVGLSPATVVASFRFRAFLSYSHRDTQWVRRLHEALESYRLDKDLVGRQTAHGIVPKTLRPIFRDREDFSAGHSLTEQTLAALQASQFLIVVCSPNAARSRYVDQEIRYFKSLGRGDRVINVIIAGEPGDPEQECFPPAVRDRIGPDGQPTGEHEEPIAADARPHGDGEGVARLKIVAGLLGVGFDEVAQRARRARRRRNRIRMAAAAMTALLVAGAFIGWRGVHLLHSELLNEQDINGLRDVADICENVDTVPVAEKWRLVLALKCVQAFDETFADVPTGTRVPRRVITMLEKSLAVLRRGATKGQLNADQMVLLKSGEAFATQIETR